MTRARDFADLASSADAGSLTGKNLVINGAMNVAQRSTSVASMGGTEGYKTLDRFNHTGGEGAGRFTSAQTAVSDLPGFLNCLHLDCTTADTSIAATELLLIEQKLEGQDLQQLKKGTSSAEPVTVSFYMKTNKAFTFMCGLNDYDNNRVNVQQFTTTTSWTRHSITFAGDTTGALDDDANHSLSVEFYLHAGSNFTGGTYSANTWQSRASSDNMRAVGIGSFFDSTDNDVKLTGLQVELGEKATPFEHRSFGDELRRCQRYYYKITPGDTGGVGTGIHNATSQATIFIPYQVAMRSGPTAVESSSTATDFDIRNNNGVIQLDSVPAFQSATRHGGEVLCNHSGSPTQGEATTLRFRTTSDFIAWSAEL